MFKEQFARAVKLAVSNGQASVSMFQRDLKVGYARAGRIPDAMEKRGIVGKADGAKPRSVRVSCKEAERVSEYSKRKLLVTGFEAFGGQAINPSAWAVSRLPDEMNDVRVCKCILPVRWADAGVALCRAVEACRPDTLLMTGQAGGADCIRLERVALNLCDGQDSAGMIRREEPAYLSAPAAYFATCDYGSVKAMLSHMGIVSAYSFFAGTYLCNYVLYTALHLYPDIPSGFLHLPYLDTQTRTPPFISARMAEQAVRTAVQALFE